MNYLSQVVGFFKVDKEYSFSPMEVTIYMRLLDRCNDLEHKNPFGLSCDEFRAKLKCKNPESKKSFDTARNKLKQAGLIDFEKGNGRGNITKYTIKEFVKGVQKEPLSAPLSAPLSGENGGYIINKDKVNENKERDEAFASLLAEVNALKIALEEEKNKKEKASPIPRTPPFQSPTQEAVTEFFFQQTGNGQVEAIKFFNHFESNGWKTGPNKIKNWEAAARKWIANGDKYSSEKPTGYSREKMYTAVQNVINKGPNGTEDFPY